MRLFLSIFLTVFCVIYSAQTALAQCVGAKDLEKWGTFENWTVREIKESILIGGEVKHSYEIAKGDTIKGPIPYVNPPHCVWSTTNVMGNVTGIIKVSCTVFPEERGDDYCVRLETRLEKIKVLGLINLNVIASGSIFLGQMLEPIRDTKNPQGKLNCGIPFTDRPEGIMFDYKVTVGNNRCRAGGLGAPKELGDNDYADCVIMLQKRWEDEEGNVYSKRIGTGYKRFTETQTEWQNNFQVDIHYGDITNEPFYRDYMELIPYEVSNYMINSKGKSVPIREIGWGNGDETPTQLIMRFSASHGEAYVGDIVNRLWIDNVRVVY